MLHNWHLRSLAFLITAGAVSSVWAQKVNPAFYGVWNLDVPRSKFADSEKPKAGQVNWNENGLIFALVLPDGSLYTDGAATNKKCRLIGIPAGYNETITGLSATHVRLVLKEGKHIRRVGDITLIDPKTTKTVHHVTPANGKPYVETTYWIKQG